MNDLDWKTKLSNCSLQKKHKKLSFNSYRRNWNNLKLSFM